jgi:hypothetical protein
MTASGDEFLAGLRSVRFDDDYYELCDRFRSTLSFPQWRARHGDVTRCLATLGRTLVRTRVDRAYLAEELVDGCAVRSGFAVQSTGALECFFGWSTPGSSHVGGQFVLIASQVRALSGRPAVDPPYPRPDYCGPDRLLELLTEWNRLDRVIRTAAGLPT